MLNWKPGSGGFDGDIRSRGQSASLQNGNDRLAKVIDVRLACASNVDPARVDHVDGVFVPQFGNLLSADAEKRKHASLPADEVETIAGPLLLEARDQKLAQLVDAPPHGGE
ncbi:MAG: hypothetical protein ACI9QQ_002595, partial [Myxococcota bacterium]